MNKQLSSSKNNFRKDKLRPIREKQRKNVGTFAHQLFRSKIPIATTSRKECPDGIAETVSLSPWGGYLEEERDESDD